MYPKNLYCSTSVKNAIREVSSDNDNSFEALVKLGFINCFIGFDSSQIFNAFHYTMIRRFIYESERANNAVLWDQAILTLCQDIGNFELVDSACVSTTTGYDENCRYALSFVQFSWFPDSRWNSLGWHEHLQMRAIVVEPTSQKVIYNKLNDHLREKMKGIHIPSLDGNIDKLEEFISKIINSNINIGK